MSQWFCSDLSWAAHKSADPCESAVRATKVIIEGASKMVAIDTEMSSDSRKSLNHRAPSLIFESRYQSRYQDCDLKILGSSLNIRAQDFRVLIPVSMSRLRFQKSWFQSRYLDSTIKSLNFSLDVHTWLMNFQPLSKPWDWLFKAKNTRKG